MSVPLKTFTTSLGNVYSYLHSVPQSQPQTLLFLHGFPSTSYDWTHQIAHFTSRGYGTLAPDLLGYGQTSKPTDVAQYRLKSISAEIAELLDHLSLQHVVGVGHDFGATLLSRLVVYHAERLDALVFLTVGPPRMGTPFDVNAINAFTKQALGYEWLGYMPWVGGDKATQEILEKHAESAMSLVFCADKKEWEPWFRPLGKMKQFVEKDDRLPIGKWYTEDLQQNHLQAFGCKDGYKGAARWYRMWMDNLGAVDEEGLDRFQIQIPALYAGVGEDDRTPGQQELMLREWVPGLKTVRVNAGHWVHLERPEETNQAIMQLLQTLQAN